ncbi:hypothetical protein M0802_000191 [Mischocyttarus mexicanus]|nr:hypothetical protein M0802_000191 [Mischocyttarus mexicanus]
MMGPGNATTSQQYTQTYAHGVGLGLRGEIGMGVSIGVHEGGEKRWVTFVARGECTTTRTNTSTTNSTNTRSTSSSGGYVRTDLKLAGKMLVLAGR